MELPLKKDSEFFQVRKEASKILQKVKEENKWQWGGEDYLCMYVYEIDKAVNKMNYFMELHTKKMEKFTKTMKEFNRTLRRLNELLEEINKQLHTKSLFEEK